MKRLIAMVLSAICLLTCAAYAGPSVRAEESEDLCAVFASLGYVADEVHWLHSTDWMIKKKAFFAAYWAYYRYSTSKTNGDDLVWGDWDGKTFTPGGRRNFVKIPAKPFDAYVPQCMALDGDFRTMLAAESEEYEKKHPCDDPAGEMEAYGTLWKLLHPQYVKELDAYLIDFFFAKGGGAGLNLRGYTKNRNGTYSVYLQWVDGIYGAIPSEDDLKEIDMVSIGLPYRRSGQFVGEKNENYIRYTTDELRVLLTDHRDWVEKNLWIAGEDGSPKKWPEVWLAKDYIEITVTYSGGPVKILDLKKTDALPAGLIEPQPRARRVSVTPVSGVTIDAGQAFPDDTSITIAPVSSGAEHDRAMAVLTDAAGGKKTAVFTFSAQLNGKEIEPRGTVSVTFAIPDGMSAKGLRLYYIAPNGKSEEIPVSVDAKRGTVTAKLTHFSTYALRGAAAAPGTSSAPATSGATGTGGKADKPGAVGTSGSSGISEAANANGTSGGSGASDTSDISDIAGPTDASDAADVSTGGSAGQPSAPAGSGRGATAATVAVVLTAAAAIAAGAVILLRKKRRANADSEQKEGKA